ncbi:MAG: tetratricopeptide repeat protein [Bacteroidaceae bacterium]|nr:tetratricopeptide repeat protein [Bacteroidaceae bacterium]
MRDDSASYYDGQEFIDLLTMYEDMVSSGTSMYFDSMDIANIAEYYSMNGELDKSDDAIEFGLDLHPQDPDILIAKAGNLLMRGRKDESRVISESIVDPDNQELMYLRGIIEVADHDYEASEIYFTQAVEMSGNDPGMLNDIIVKYMDEREFDLCQKWLDRALVMSPDSRNFIELQADLYFDTGQMDTAIVWYNHLLDEFAYDTYYWEQLGRIYFEKSDYPKARECFEFIEAIDPASDHARLMKGNCLLQMKQWTEAAEIYRPMLEEDPTSPTLHYYYGRCLLEMDDPDTALIHFQLAWDCLDDDDENIVELHLDLYTDMARCCLKSGKTEMAKIYVCNGLQLDPLEPELIEMAKYLLSPDELEQALNNDNTND